MTPEQKAEEELLARAWWWVQNRTQVEPLAGEILGQLVTVASSPEHAARMALDAAEAFLRERDRRAQIAQRVALHAETRMRLVKSETADVS